MTDVSGSVPNQPSPSQQFIALIKDGWTHSPKTKEEALALYHYAMRSQIEPAINALVLAVVAELPEAEAALVKAALAGAEVALAKCGCW